MILLLVYVGGLQRDSTYLDELSDAYASMSVVEAEVVPMKWIDHKVIPVKGQKSHIREENCQFGTYDYIPTW